MKLPKSCGVGLGHPRRKFWGCPDTHDTHSGCAYVPQGMAALELHQNLRQQKCRFPGLSLGVGCMMVGSAVSKQYRRVTDKDGWTLGRNTTIYHSLCRRHAIRYDTIRYSECARKLTYGQLNLPHGNQNQKKIRRITVDNKMRFSQNRPLYVVRVIVHRGSFEGGR